MARRRLTFAPIPEAALSAQIAPEAYENLDEAMFRTDTEDDGSAEAVVRPSTTYWHDVWQRFRRDPLALFGLFVILVMGVACILVPMLFKVYVFRHGPEQHERRAEPFRTCAARIRWGATSHPHHVRRAHFPLHRHRRGRHQFCHRGALRRYFGLFGRQGGHDDDARRGYF